jgi:hypothetical protein
VLVAKVNGEVTMTLNGTTRALKVDDQVPQAATVSTNPSASVVLVFSNGTTIMLGGQTELVVERFLQEPFGQTVVVNILEMQEEPSPSSTILNLKRGELVASSSS